MFAADAPLVGREEELEQIEKLLCRDVPLVTLVGTGGVGKTRLAAELRSHWEGDTFLVDATNSGEVHELVGEAASVMGLALPGVGVEQALTTIGNHLRQRRHPLVVIDNAETALEAVATVVRSCCEAAPQSRVLVTSREPLRLRFEARLEILPLTAVDAVELFNACVERVRGRPLNVEELSEAAELVEELDRLPLAVLLAASRSNVLSPSQLRARVQGRMALLRGQPRDWPDRHATMHAAIDWSWQMLDENERAAFAQCAAFRAPFTAEAAEHVLAPEPSGGDVLSVVQALRERSLLQGSLEAGSVRFRLLECIREFAMERLEALGAEREALLDRHAVYFADLIREVVRRVPANDALVELALYAPDLKAALEHSASRMPALGAQLALALEQHFAYSGSAELWPQMCERALVLAQRAGDESLIAQGLIAAVRSRRVDMSLPSEDGREMLERAIELSTASGDWMTESDAWRQMGIWGFVAGDLEEAASKFERAAQAAADGGDTQRLASAQANRAHAMWRDGKRDAASQIMSDLMREVESDPSVLQWLRRYRSEFAIDAGELNEAQELLEAEALDLMGHPDPRRRGEIPVALGKIAMERGDAKQASLHFGKARDVARSLGLKDIEGWAEWGLGLAELETGSREAAYRHLETGEAAFERIRQPHSITLRAFRAASLMNDDAGRSIELFTRCAEERSVPAHEADRAAIKVLLLGRGVLADNSPGRVKEVRAAVVAEPGDWHLARSGASVLLASLDLLRARSKFEVQELRIAHDASWFELGEQRIELGRRPILARIFKLLVERRQARAGQSITLDELQKAGWAGERMSARSATKRIQTAISTLRKLGLGNLLEHDGSGYLLNPAVRLKAAPGPE